MMRASTVTWMSVSQRVGTYFPHRLWSPGGCSTRCVHCRTHLPTLKSLEHIIHAFSCLLSTYYVPETVNCCRQHGEQNKHELPSLEPIVCRIQTWITFLQKGMQNCNSCAYCKARGAETRRGGHRCQSGLPRWTSGKVLYKCLKNYMELNSDCSINTRWLVDWLLAKPSEILRRKGVGSPSFLLHNYFSAFKASHFSSYTLNIRENWWANFIIF